MGFQTLTSPLCSNYKHGNNFVSASVWKDLYVIKRLKDSTMKPSPNLKSSEMPKWINNLYLLLYTPENPSIIKVGFEVVSIT